MVVTVSSHNKLLIFNISRKTALSPKLSGRSMPKKTENAHIQSHIFSKNNKNQANFARALSLPLIYCKCGQPILVVPDVKAMSKAIEGHITGNCKAKKPSKAKPISEEELRQHLIVQVLEVASKADI
jgi:hypothetical protein